jgi:hypothetical protein
MNTVVGLPVSLRGRTGYGLTRVRVFDISPLYLSRGARVSPYLRDSLLIDQGGHRTVSKISIWSSTRSTRRFS